MRKRVLLIRSNGIAPDPRVKKEARTLNKLGFDVSILGWDRSTKLPKEEVWDSIPIFRISFEAKFGNGLKNLPAILIFQVLLTLWLLRNIRSFDCLHACDFDTIIPSLIISKLTRRKIVYDIFDFYSDHLRKTPEFIKSTIRKLDLFIIGQVDGVILVDEIRKKQIEESTPKHLISIYNSPLVKNHYPEDMLAGLQLPSFKNLTLIYVGLLQEERGIFDILEVIKNNPNWDLILGGFGGKEQEIQQQCKSLSNAYFLGRISYTVATTLFKKSDVFLALYDPKIPNHKYASPNKIFEAMAFSKPVIINKGIGADRLIEKHKTGLTVEYGETKDLFNAIHLLDLNRNLMQQFGENGKKAYDSDFSWGIMENRLARFYQEIFLVAENDS